MIGLRRLSLGAVVVAACVALALIVLVMAPVRALRVPSGGMAMTILPGDRILVDNRVFGFPIPLLDLRLPAERSPQRGDVITFLNPRDRRLVLKRVVGLPGETLRIHLKTVYVEERPLDEPYAFFGGSTNAASASTPDWGPQLVPASQFFVLGDNRNNSWDSRYWGFLSMNDVRGLATVVVYSVDENGRIRRDRLWRPIR